MTSLTLTGNFAGTVARRRPQASAMAPRIVAEPAMQNDQLCDLIEAIAASKDRAAFAELFRHFAPRLKAFGMRQGADAAEAEELAQEAMLSVWRRAGTFDRSRATAATWIFTIVRNKRIDMYRREHRSELMLDDVPDRPSESAGADEELQASRAGSALREAMNALPPEQLEVVQKAFYEDKSHSEIAAELKLPLGTVKSRVRLALGRLRSVVSEDHL